MFLRDWYRPSFWRWWWHNRAPLEARLGLAVLVAAIVAGAGYLSEGLLTPAKGASVYTVITTVRTLERVQETVTRAGGVRVVRVPTREVVTLPGSERTIRDRVLVTLDPTTTVVDRVTVDHAALPVRGPARTVTVTAPSVTVVHTRLVARPRAQVSVRVVTERDPAGPRVAPQTVTELRTVTAASTSTVTEPLTVTDSQTATAQVVRTLTTPAVTATVTTTRTATEPAKTVTTPVTSTTTTTVATTVATTVTVTSTRTEPLTVTVTVPAPGPAPPPPPATSAPGPPAGNKTST